MTGLDPRDEVETPPDFVGTTFLKHVLLELTPDPDLLQRPVDEAEFAVEIRRQWLFTLFAGVMLIAGFGFALGCTSLFASALLTAGVGPWLPFQMICAAWVGMGAGFVPGRQHPVQTSR